MHRPPPRLLYIGASVPARTETFVYREVLELRRRGIEVCVASVHDPDYGLVDPELRRLSEQIIHVYSTGKRRLLADAMKIFIRRPLRCGKTIATGLTDAFFGRQVPLARRPKLVWQCLAGLALAYRIRELGIDRIHAHMAHVPTSIAMYAAMTQGIPFSFTGHAADLFRDYSLLPAKLARADFVACISQWHRCFYREKCPSLTDADLPLIRCGVELHDGPCQPKLAGAPFRLLAVGRLVEKKGFDTLIHALVGLRDHGVDFECRIVGDGPMRNALTQLIQQLGLGSRVELAGFRENDDVRKMMQEFDLFVLPCKPTSSGDRDGIPVALIEAMAAGMPVVSGDLATIRELIEHDKSGRLVPAADVSALRDNLLDLFRDSERRFELASAGRERVATEFSLTDNIERLVDVIRSHRQVLAR